MVNKTDFARTPEPKGMKPREFAKRYGLSANSVYEGCRNGSIPNVRVGNRFVILWQEWENQAKFPEPLDAKNNTSANKG
jgi:hypothetical protein